ncbi:MAG: ABC transporter ATP-binding protein [Clostridiaceae bacterium]|nr:ABC transporter ATP-binding protein [Clostridiaceae bacterium]
MNDELIQVTELSKQYKVGYQTVDALKNVNLEISQGQFVSIMGKSGSGKSTLLHLLGGLDRPTTGSVWIDGQVISALPEAKLSLFRRKNLGFVFQFFNLIPELNLKENIIFPALLEQKNYDIQYFNELCDALEISDRLRHLPDQVSGGQQQRAAIARALILKPRAIFLDEPTGNLDDASSRSVLGLLRELTNRWRQTIVMVTHDSDAAACADRIIELKDGKVQ